MRRSSSILPLCAAALAVTLPTVSRAIGQQTSASTPPDSEKRVIQARVSENYGRIPLGFEANRGQADPSVQFLSHGRGYTLLSVRQRRCSHCIEASRES
jgi:hypothetical protein